MTASIVAPGPRRPLRDAAGRPCLILAQRARRVVRPCAHPREDIALTNMALDLIGQARALFTLAGGLNARAGGIALRRRPAGLPCARARLPQPGAGQAAERSAWGPVPARRPAPAGRDFAFTVLRNAMMATWLELLWQHLASSTGARAGGHRRQGGEGARYHREHAADWKCAGWARRHRQSARRLAPHCCRAAGASRAELFATDAPG